MQKISVRMIKTPESSIIDAIGYVGEVRQLFLMFRSGSVYTYFDVPATRFADLRDAKSKDQFFANMIKPYFAAHSLAGTHDAVFFFEGGPTPVKPPRAILEPSVDSRWAW